MPKNFTPAALAALFCALMPSAAFTAPIDDGTNIPVAQGEAPARSCYMRAEQQWNRIMAESPRDRQRLNSSYRAFAGCAKLAIDTGKVLRGGERLPWMPEYFADTVGATYAQLQLATITINPEHCSHLKTAQSLAEQALETEGEMDTPGDANFESKWQTLAQNVRMQTSGCARVARSS